jgi:hypothetical protein
VETGRRRFYVNAASLIPWSLGSGGPKRAVELAAKAGFDGLQLLPLRGWTLDTIGTIPEGVIVAYEDAWNQGTLAGAVSRQLGMVGDEQPLLLDWMLFGSKPLDVTHFGQLFHKALKIVHNTWDFGSYEINPEGGFPRPGKPVVWDTLHIRRPRRDGALSTLSHWRTLLAQLEARINLIHVHPTIGAETESLRAGCESELNTMIRVLGKHTPKAVPIVLEVAPIISTPSGTVEYLNRLRGRVCELMLK